MNTSHSQEKYSVTRISSSWPYKTHESCWISYSSTECNVSTFHIQFTLHFCTDLLGCCDTLYKCAVRIFREVTSLMLVHFVPLKYRGPSDIPIQMCVIKYKQYLTHILLKRVKYANNMTVILSSDWILMQCFVFCLAGFTWRYSHNSLKEEHCSFPNRLEKTPGLVCVCESWETCGLLWLVLHLSGFWRKCRKWWGQKRFSSSCGFTPLCYCKASNKTGQGDREGREQGKSGRGSTVWQPSVTCSTGRTAR